MARENAKVATKIRADLQAKAAAANGAPPLRALPPKGAPAPEVKKRMQYKEREDVRFSDGDSRVSGTVYMAGAVHKQVCVCRCKGGGWCVGAWGLPVCVAGTVRAQAGACDSCAWVVSMLLLAATLALAHHPASRAYHAHPTLLLPPCSC